MPRIALSLCCEHHRPHSIGFVRCCAQVGDFLTFAGRDNYTVVVANSTRCILVDLTILSAPGFAITEIDGEGGCVWGWTMDLFEYAVLVSPRSRLYSVLSTPI